MTIGAITGAGVAVGGGGALLQLAQASGAAATLPYGQLGRVVVPFASAGEGAAGVFAALRPFGVLALPLMLSGDTPQPREADLGGNLRLSVTADGKQAWLSEMRPGTALFGLVNTMDAHMLNTRVSVDNGQLSFDAGQLERELGHPLPPSVVAMAGARPAGVPATLQTTQSGIVTGMRAATMDPCRDMDGQRHHMIPASLMNRNQQFLTAIGFRLDQPANLVRLPSTATQRTDMQALCGETRPLHNGPNTSKYNQAVQGQLTRIQDAVRANRIDAAEARSAVGRLMNGIRQEIVSGGHANVNDPALARAIANLKVL